MKKQQRRIVSDMLRAVMGVCCAIQLTVATAYGGWLQTASGTYDYLEATNWTDNVIDNTFPATLTLAGAQTATFGADHTAASGLVFGYGGNFALTLRAAGGDRSLKLQGDVLVDTTGGTTANVTFGGAIAPGPGAGVGTMKFGALTLEEGAALNLGLGVPAASDKVAVNGSLVLDGVVNVAAAEGFGVGYYPIATYTGSLADNGLEVGTTPDPGLVYSVRAGGGLVTLRVNAPGTAIVVR